MTTMKAEDIAYISCRTRKPWTSKINPAWWFMNDDEQRVEDAPWYRPEWPAWFRVVVWNLLRNPLQNFRAYVVGVSDRNYVVRGRAPVMTVQRNDLVPPEYGYQWCVIELRWLRLPFVSYSGRHVVWYAGWQPSGFFGCKFNLHRGSDGGNASDDHGAEAPRHSCGSRWQLVCGAGFSSAGEARPRPFRGRRGRLVRKK